MSSKHCSRNKYALIVACIYSLAALSYSQPSSTPITASPTTTSSSGYVLEFVAGPGTWSAAEAGCASKGGHLASISSGKENAEARSLCSDTIGCWLGLNDQAAEGKYVWSDSSSSTYTAWSTAAATAQPDGDTKAKTAEDCVLFAVASTAKDVAGWHDRSCSEQHAYICKVPKAAQPTPIPVGSPAAMPPSPTMNPNSTAGSKSTAGDAQATNTSTNVNSNTASAASAAAAATAAPSSTVATPANPGASGAMDSSTSSSSSSTAPSPSGSTTGSSSSSSNTPATSVTGTVTTAGLNAASLASALGSNGISTDNAANTTSSQPKAQDKEQEPWKLVVSIVVPVLTGVAALITIAYTGWKWWHKRQATLLSKKLSRGMLSPNASLVSQSSGLKPLVAVGSDRMV